MKQFNVLEESFTYGLTIHTARRLTDEEKPRYAEWFRDLAFVSLGNKAKLAWFSTGKDTLLSDIAKRPADGCFLGTSNRAWIISADEAAELVARSDLEAQRQADDQRAARIADLTRIIDACNHQCRLYTRQEAAKMRKQYNDTHNEGGEGYVPHYWTIDDYERAKTQLAALTQDTARKEVMDNE